MPSPSTASICGQSCSRPGALEGAVHHHLERGKRLPELVIATSRALGRLRSSSMLRSRPCANASISPSAPATQRWCAARPCPPGGRSRRAAPPPHRRAGAARAAAAPRGENQRATDCRQHVEKQRAPAVPTAAIARLDLGRSMASMPAKRARMRSSVAAPSGAASTANFLPRRRDGRRCCVRRARRDARRGPGVSRRACGQVVERPAQRLEVSSSRLRVPVSRRDRGARRRSCVATLPGLDVLQRRHSAAAATRCASASAHPHHFGVRAGWRGWTSQPATKAPGRNRINRGCGKARRSACGADRSTSRMAGRAADLQPPVINSPGC